MTNRNYRRFSVLTVVLAALVLLAGCSEDYHLDAGSDLVRIVDEKDRSPVVGLKVVLMDFRSNLPAAGPLVSRADGTCDFGVLPAAGHGLIVFGGVDYVVHAQPNYSTKDGGSADSGLLSPFAPVDKTSVPPIKTVEVQVRKVIPDSLPRIAGRVVDGETGLPLDLVFVSLSPLLTGYQGGGGASDDVTLDDGNFSVSRIPFARDPVTGNIHQIEPLRFTRHGYRPLIWSYDPPNGSANVDIKGVAIAMTPVDQGDGGAISGRLLRDGLPAAGVVVGLGVLGSPEQEKAGAGLTGWAAVSDQDGRFTIGQLPAGTYTAQPGFPLGDGACLLNPLGGPAISVEGDQTVDAGDLVVLHEISPRWPYSGAGVSYPLTSLGWSEVPGAVAYEVWLDRELLGRTTSGSMDLPDSLVVVPGDHYWTVGAFDAHDEISGVMQVNAVFRLLPPPE